MRMNVSAVIDKVQQQVSCKSKLFAAGRMAVALVALLVTLRFGRYVLATPAFISDDEGYLLLSLKHYFAGEHLYTQVFSQYGPFYFLLQRAVFELMGLPVSFDGGRIAAYIYWTLSAVLGGFFIYRLSKNATLASAACLATMWLGRVIAREPNHPDEVVLVLLTAGCAVSVNPSPIALVFLGAIGTALFFTKPNIGIFFIAAALIASACMLPAGLLRRISGGLLLLAVVTGPIVLMHHFLNSWAGGFCLISVLAGTSTLLSGLRTDVYAPGGMKVLRYVVAGTITTVILIILETTLERLSLRTVLDGVVLGPLHQPEVFVIPFIVSKKMAVLATVLAICMAGLYWFPERWEKRPAMIDALKCLAGILVIGFLVIRNLSYWEPRSFYFAPLYAALPLILLPGRTGKWEASEYFPRIFIAALAAMQVLQAYSVAGSQANIGAAPFLLWAFVCIHDGADGLFVLSSSTRSWHEHISAASVLGGVVAVVVTVAMLRHGIWHRHYPTPASSLAGSSSLHLSSDLEVPYEALTRDLQANCRVLFSMPGMGNFNFWSGVPTPDGFNEDNWMRGIPVELQLQTLQVLKKNPSACVLYKPDMLAVWGVPDRGIETLPLAYYILHDMPTVFARWGYEIHVSPNRRDPWVERSAVSVP